MKPYRFLFVALLSVVAVFFLAGCRSASEPQAVSTAERTFEFTYVAKVPALKKGREKLRLWIPVPQPDANQDIEEIVIESPVAYEFRRESEYGNQYAYFEASAEEVGTGFDISMTVRVRRRENKVDVATAQGGWLEKAWAAGSSAASSGWTASLNLARNLQADRKVPLEGVVAALAAQEVDRNAPALEKARQVYDYVVSTMRYDKSGEGWGEGDVLFACDTKRGNCTDFHSVFTGMLRASGVPARFEIGFPLPPDRSEMKIGGYHCWSSFYVEGLGWVPVDASEAWKHPEKRDYFFGAHDEHRVLFSLGRDIVLDPKQAGEPLNYFIYPYAEADGKEIEIETEFSFRDVGSLN